MTYDVYVTENVPVLIKADSHEIRRDERGYSSELELKQDGKVVAVFTQWLGFIVRE